MSEGCQAYISLGSLDLAIGSSRRREHSLPVDRSADNTHFDEGNALPTWMVAGGDRLTALVWNHPEQVTGRLATDRRIGTPLPQGAMQSLRATLDPLNCQIDQMLQ